MTPEQHHRAEVLNTLTHAAGLVASLAGAFVLVQMSLQSRNPLEAPSVVVYCASLVLVYLASTLYHAARHVPTKKRLQVLDHSAIYLLIAGTYTPLLLLGVGGTLGWSLLVLVWAMAACGIVFKWFFTGRYPLVSTLAYVGMGWVALLGGEPLLSALPVTTVFLVVAGGVAYTVGAMVFLVHRPWAHPVWHVCVLVGSSCHFAAVAARVSLA